ncbi:MAG: xanthine dehydrogenase family protein molybdopterin-binding subunit [Gammaproteobacteria bacterium]
MSTRREFLKVVALAGGGFAVGFVVPETLRSNEARADELFAPNPWLRIGADGAVTVVVDKSEMGQGVLTSLPMIVADELDADWSKVRYEVAPAAPQYAHPWFKVQGTGGSTSVRAMWEPLRKASAAARDLLLSAAADTWKVDKNTLTTANGMVLGADGKQAAYGDLAAKAAALPAPDLKQIKLKDPKDFKLIGKAIKRLDTPLKVNGQGKFGLDVYLPGMLTAVVARAPVVGAKVVGFNANKAKTIPGVKEVVQIESPTSAGVAVVADGYWAAKQGRDALEIQWDNGANATLSSAGISRAMAEAAKQEGVVAHKEGDVASAKAAKTVEAVYEYPYLVHAPMEPMNCTAWVKPDGVEIWAGSQAQGPNQMTVAAITGVKPEQVKINTQLLGGGFGRRFAPDFLIESVLVSKAVKAPVKLVYSREDDVKAYYYRPAVYTALQGGLDEAGQPVMVQARTVSSSIAAGSGMEGALLKDRLDVLAVEGLSEWVYATPNFQCDWVPYEPGVRTWFWRSVGSSHNAFSQECFIDELAHTAGKDPFEYRRALLTNNPRHKAVLELAAEKAGWGTPLPQGQARGIAVAKSFGSWVAEVAEVSLEQGKVKVNRVVIAADIGTVVNPDTVKAQMEGAMVYGLSAALYGKITLKDGQVEQSNFHDYPVLRMNEMPKVEVYLVDSKEPPGGVGEPGTPPIAPAVANALFVLTGKRVRSLPLADHKFA